MEGGRIASRRWRGEEGGSCGVLGVRVKSDGGVARSWLAPSCHEGEGGELQSEPRPFSFVAKALVLLRGRGCEARKAPCMLYVVRVPRALRACLSGLV